MIVIFNYIGLAMAALGIGVYYIFQLLNIAAEKLNLVPNSTYASFHYDWGYVFSGSAILIADIIVRRKISHNNRMVRLLGPKNGGQIMFIPVWVIGQYYLFYGLYIMIRCYYGEFPWSDGLGFRIVAIGGLVCSIVAGVIIYMTMKNFSADKELSN